MIVGINDYRGKKLGHVPNFSDEGMNPGGTSTTNDRRTEFLSSKIPRRSSKKRNPELVRKKRYILQFPSWVVVENSDKLHKFVELSVVGNKLTLNSLKLLLNLSLD